MVNAFLLSTAIAWGQIPPGSVAYYQDSEREAYRALGKACYREFGIDTLAKDLEKEYIPEYVKEYGIWPTLIIKAISEKRLSYEWTF